MERNNEIVKGNTPTNLIPKQKEYKLGKTKKLL